MRHWAEERNHAIQLLQRDKRLLSYELRNVRRCRPIAPRLTRHQQQLLNILMRHRVSPEVLQRCAEGGYGRLDTHGNPTGCAFQQPSPTANPPALTANFIPTQVGRRGKPAARTAAYLAQHYLSTARLVLETQASSRKLAMCRELFVNEQCLVPNPHRPGQSTTVRRQLRVVAKYLKSKTLALPIHLHRVHNPVPFSHILRSASSMIEAKQHNGAVLDAPQPSLRLQLLVQYGCMFLWIFLSAFVILVNKYVLSISGFPYPVALTCSHMLFCSILAWCLVKIGWADVVPISADTYLRYLCQCCVLWCRCILPIGLLFAITLWTGNAAYLYLSVSFIQMLKASMPMVVYVVGVMFATEKFTLFTGLNMIVVGTGIGIASYGEILFVWVGVILQAASICTESVRLTLVQILLQSRGIKMNPISSLYHIAPCCFVFLALPFTYIELPKMMRDPTLRVNVPLLLVSASGAFALNMAVFLLIGKTSALTMNVAGVVKDWLLILLSVVLYGKIQSLKQQNSKVVDTSDKVEGGQNKANN
ncbi:hypothetical protein QJQ45_018216 [Haematococcus lacustris]|nr:hypothetical protein QJQ45_018216 [Haematococcus lacustris]